MKFPTEKEGFSFHLLRFVFLIDLYNKNKLVAVHRAHIGSTGVVHPREVLKASILSNDALIINAHQHPSEDVTPSLEDI